MKKDNNKKFNRWLMALLIIGICLIMPTIALGWPSNHVDSSANGDMPHCISCHSYKAGYLTIKEINGKMPRSNSVTITQSGAFDMTFSTVGLGYGRFTVSGAVQVPDTDDWTLASITGGDTPWFIAEQSTTYGAPPLSPYMWATAFPAVENPNAQKGVTIDDGSTSGAYIDRNLTAHDEEFTVHVEVYDQPLGTYNLKVWGIGTSSTGALSYNEKVLTVNVTNDITAPTTPTGLSASTASTSSISLSWAAASDADSGVDGYEIYRSPAATGPYEYIGYATNTSYTDTELADDTSYYYRVATVDNSGNISGYSDSASATTSSGTREDITPIAPQGLNSFVLIPEGFTDKVVKLQWNPNTEGDVEGYKVYRSTELAGEYALITPNLITSKEQLSVLDENKGVVVNAVYYYDTNYKFGTTYYYKVSAVDVDGKESPLSSYVAATPAVDAGAVNPHGNYDDPANAGLCGNCHSTHSARGSELINYSSITDSCYTCHDGSQSKYNTKAAFDPVSNPSHHKVPEGRYSCDVCHNPHYSSPMTIQKDGDTVVETVYRLLATVSKEDGNIKRGGNEFCWACHGVNSDLPNPFGRDHQTAFITSKHNSMSPASAETEIVCRNCHAPHGSKDYPLIITANSANFCITCHKNNNFLNTDLLNDDGTVNTANALPNQSNNYLGTIHEKNFYGRNTCTMCHEPHGSINTRYMLRDPYNDKFTTANVSGAVYGPVEWANNQEADTICFRCHDSNYYVGQNGNGDALVGSNFGNGNGKNYHDHTTKWKVSCRACHDPHSGQTGLIGKEEDLNNGHYINFDWAYQTSTVSESSYNNTFAFIPALGMNLEVTGYSCALTCHVKEDTGVDHKISDSGEFLSYIRTGNSPALKCAACHDFDLFDTNSRHPVISEGPETGYMVNCEQCHIEDHTKHDSSNPYGLRSEITTNWSNGVSSGNITTTLGTVIDPDTGEEVPAYKEFCWHCHGEDNTINAENRNILGDHKSDFDGKPHSKLEREGTDNPYGPGIDIACLRCHTHHSSSNVRLLKKTIDNVAIDAATDNGKIQACMACHDGYPGEIDISTKYNAESHGGHYIKADPTKKLLCTECHDPHGSSNVSYLRDTDKYQTGINFPSNIENKGNSRNFCLACHPTAEETEPRVYNTVYTIQVNQAVYNNVYIDPLPFPDRIADHKSTGTRECVICHDAHKPWPPTGGEDNCYGCHSSDGEAQDIRALAGLTPPPEDTEHSYYPGLTSHHTISDGYSADNTCMARCHAPHPHAPRANLIKPEFIDEKTMCLNCHSTVASETYRAPYTIDVNKYIVGPHDYRAPINTFSDNSTFFGNCDKCHNPHGSRFSPLLQLPKDELCVNCHNGVARNAEGDIIPDIKTQYSSKGHSYVQYPNAKMYCDECHVPHGSTNDNYLRDYDTYSRDQSIMVVTENVYEQVYFPQSMLGETYKPRQFCITCHKEYKEDEQRNRVISYVYYSSETVPGENVVLPSLRKVLDHVTIPEHEEGDPTQCTTCHNPHDPEPVGSDYNCFNCHGENGYTTRIQPLTGLMVTKDGGVTFEQTWPDGIVAKQTYHPIYDGNTNYDPINEADADITTNSNSCMVMCHQPHMHNPRADMLKDKRPSYGDEEPPLNPTNFTAEATSAVSARVYWSASQSADVFGYYVYRKIGNGNWSKYGIVNNEVYNDPGQTNIGVWFDDGGLRPGTTVYYQVYARDINDNVNYDPASVGDPVAVTPSLSSDHESPSEPTDLKISVPNSAGSTRLTLTWSPAKDNYKVVQYHVYRDATENFIPSDANKIGSTGVTNFTDSGLTPETGYYYRVKAVDDNGNLSPATAPVFYETLSADNFITKGYYTEGNYVFEITDADGNTASEFPLGSNVYVRVKVLNGTLDTNQVREVYFKDHLNNKLQTFTNPIHSTEGDYDIFTFNVQLPTMLNNDYIYSGAYMLEADVTTTTGINLQPYQTIKYGATVRGFKFYKDNTYAQEAYSFKPGETVYVKVATDYPADGYNSPTLKYRSFDRTTDTTLSFVDAPTYEYGFTKFSFKAPSANDGWWYMINFWSQSNGRRWPLISDYGAMLLIKSEDITPPETISTNPVLEPGTNTMYMSWGASSNSEGDLGAYNIYRRGPDDNGVFYLAGSTTSTGFMDYGLKSGTGYEYQVKAVDLHGNISTANTVNGTTAVYNILSDITPPNEPYNLSVESSGRSQVTLNWLHKTANADGVIGYAILRSRNNVEYELIGKTENTTYLDTNIRGNTLYYYKIAAYDRAGNISEYTPPVSIVSARTGDDSIEGILCMSCHDGIQTPPGIYGELNLVKHTIGTSYNYSKHNVDYPRFTMSDGSQFESNCTKCHDPHGSDNKHLLREIEGVTDVEEDNQLCRICHTEPSASGKYAGILEYNKTAHGQPTNSTYDFSAVGTPRVWPGYDYDGNGDYISSPWDLSPRISGVDEGRCYNCHAPHGRFVPGSDKGKEDYIKSSVWIGSADNLNELCYTCHDGINGEYAYGEWGGRTVYETTYHGNSAYNAKMKLDNYSNGECINCHEPHSDEEGAMLRYPVNVIGDNKNKLCLNCHDRADILEDTGLFDGSKVYNNSSHGLSAQWLEDFNTVGGQVYNKTTWEKGVCMNCHNSHGRTIDGSTDSSMVIPKMLVVDDGQHNEICNKCHEHTSVSTATVGYPGRTVFEAGVHSANAQWPGGRYYEEGNTSDLKGKCINCHDPHGTAEIDAWGNVTNIQGNTFDWEEKLCYECHDGQAHPEYGIPAIANLKFWEQQGIGHLPGASFLVHSFNEDIQTEERHVECLDCHNVHSVQDMDSSEVLLTRLSKAFKGVSGIKVKTQPTPKVPSPVTDSNDTDYTGWVNEPYALSGYTYDVVDDVSTVPEELREYMVCFKCHSSYSSSDTGGKRIIGFMNTGNISTHGFSFDVKTTFDNTQINNNAATLFPDDPTKPGYVFHPNRGTEQRFNLTCSDCHGNSQLTDSATGQALPRGPHGANWEYILRGNPRSAEFCNLCHIAARYGTSELNGDGAGTGSVGAHATSQHYSDPSGSMNAGDVNIGFSLFSKQYGVNYCRSCHFGGYIAGETKYNSVHGENAAFRTDKDNDGYEAKNGVNGFYISDAGPSIGCWTQGRDDANDDDYECRHSTGAGGWSGGGGGGRN